jgi:lipopolysaccharide/colanic/teichoic acid biosynthesis glycosyltransferase
MKYLGLGIKRLIDVVLSFIALIILAIPFAIIGLLIRRDSPGPVFFKQERVGKDRRLFKVWKFRTMIDGAVYQGLGYTVEENDTRITKIGDRLRDLSLDELPQIVNVLVGSMSLVGPRPTLQYQVEHYDENQLQRLEMKPGITSLAVVGGRNALSWEERIRLDIEYVKTWSLWLDIKILFKTIWVVIVKREGLYGEDGVNDPFVEPPSAEEIRRTEGEHVE